MNNEHYSVGEICRRVERSSGGGLDDIVLATATSKGLFVFSEGVLYKFSCAPYLIEAEKADGGIRLTFLLAGKKLAHVLFDGTHFEDDGTSQINDPNGIINGPIKSLTTLRTNREEGNQRFYQMALDTPNKVVGTIAVVSEEHDIAYIDRFRSKVACSGSSGDIIVAGLADGSIKMYTAGLRGISEKTIGNVGSVPKRIFFENSKIYIATETEVREYSGSELVAEYPLPNCKSLVKAGSALYMVNDTEIAVAENGDIVKPVTIFRLEGGALNFIGELNEERALIGLANGDYISCTFDSLRRRIMYDVEEKDSYTIAERLTEVNGFRQELSLTELTRGINLPVDMVYRSVLIGKK